MEANHNFTGSDTADIAHVDFDQYWAEYDFTVNGFTNQFTFEAYMYVIQEDRHAQLYRMIKNGTIELKKLKKFYTDHCEQVDLSDPYPFDWMPREDKYKLSINWEEVAECVTKSIIQQYT